MHASSKAVALGTFAALAAFASFTVSAQTQPQSDGSDYRPMQTNNSTSMPEVAAGARSAARPTDTESIGQSTSAPMPTGQLTRAEVYKGAVEAAHPLQTESIGQSTGMAGITGGAPH
ncbi:hypothetical protein VAR608DRAFT_3008 [Variovorax sp. HW608]|uniref:hypothetical protein n=1 Tax=Variovorax sp. HW608 TaxID=1034889 RepID=UPI0008201B56|nr:hypothetical protein [Variovorax sp. HW608]SCK33850.1 hypothetical protein VAR608DRAFT_3008 [Variovorax sp. HW608]